MARMLSSFLSESLFISALKVSLQNRYWRTVNINCFGMLFILTLTFLFFSPI